MIRWRHQAASVYGRMYPQWCMQVTSRMMARGRSDFGLVIPCLLQYLHRLGDVPHADDAGHDQYGGENESRQSWVFDHCLYLHQSAIDIPLMNHGRTIISISMPSS
jgi:hypothetical protein